MFLKTRTIYILDLICSKHYKMAVLKRIRWTICLISVSLIIKSNATNGDDITKSYPGIQTILTPELRLKETYSEAIQMKEYIKNIGNFKKPIYYTAS